VMLHGVGRALVGVGSKRTRPRSDLAGAALQPVAPGGATDVSLVAHGSSCTSPVRQAAPGPGRSPTESTSATPVAGTQKTLTRVEATGEALVVSAPAGAPVSVIVRAGPIWNAPGLRCRQTGNWPTGQTLAQSASLVHGAGGSAKFRLNCWPQNPQATKF